MDEKRLRAAVFQAMDTEYPESEIDSIAKSIVWNLQNELTTSDDAPGQKHQTRTDTSLEHLIERINAVEKNASEKIERLQQQVKELCDWNGLEVREPVTCESPEPLVAPADWWNHGYLYDPNSGRTDDPLEWWPKEVGMEWVFKVSNSTPEFASAGYKWTFSEGMPTIKHEQYVSEHVCVDASTAAVVIGKHIVFPRPVPWQHSLTRNPWRDSVS